MLVAKDSMVGEAGLGTMLLTVPPIVTLKPLKSLVLGEVPKDAPVMLAPVEAPMEAPLSRLIVVALFSEGAVMTRVDVKD